MDKILACVAVVALSLGCANKGESNVTPKTEEQKTLYALGLSMGRSVNVFHLSKEELTFVEQGLSDSVNGRKPQVELQVYGPKLQELARARAGVSANKEKEKGHAFVEQAAKEPGAEKLASGLVFKSLKPGNGPSPKASDTVKVHYHGTLADGTVFDSSVQRGEPAEFPLGGVIPCWTEGVQKMKVGEKAKLVCPSDIAYRDQGRPPKIPGGATLVFEIELLEIKAQATPPASLTTPPPQQLQLGGKPLPQSGGKPLQLNIKPAAPAPAKPAK